MTTQEIVSKLWNLCNVLRDDGITYHQYVTELTYILFLKMADETGTDKNIPEEYLVFQDPAVNKAKIKEDFKAGKDIGGFAHLESQETLVIT